MLETYLNMLDEGYFEVKFAFEGLADTNVWKRPVAGLLSVGELAGHIAYWEAVKLAGEGGMLEPDLAKSQEDTGNQEIWQAQMPKPDLARCRVRSLLVDRRFSYFPTTIANPPSEEHLLMTSEQVRDELLRVHREAVAIFKALNPSLDSSLPGWPPNHTYGAFLQYAVFHVAYHTGQMYTVRHLLGEETPDN